MSGPFIEGLQAGAYPEAALLLACGRTALDDLHAERALALLHQPLNWPYLLTQARWHKVAPLLCRNLEAIGPHYVPSEAWAALCEERQGSAWAQLFLTGELLGLLRHFAASGITPIPFKGPLLARQLYGDPALRPCDDLDILIQQQDFSQAQKLLGSQGYRPVFALNEIPINLYLKSHHDCMFVRASGPVYVDLQWAITRTPFAFPKDIERWWERVRPTSIAGNEVLSFSVEDLLLILCVHGAKHMWDRLIWVCDIAELLGSQQPIDWELVTGRARALGVERMLLLGLWLAHTMLEVPLSASLIARAQRSPAVAALARQVQLRLFNHADSPEAAEVAPLFFLRMVDRWQERAQICRHCAPGLLHPLRLLRRHGLPTLKELVGY